MLRYLVTLSRPRFWLYLAGPVLVGVSYAAADVPELFSAPAVALFAYFLVPANVYLYGVNDVFDRDVDEANPKKEGREARFRGGRAVTAVVAVSGALLLALAPVVPAVAYPWLAGWFLLATEYSAPPFRFKTTPFLDSLSNGLYVLPGAAAYAAVAGQHPPLLAVAGGWLWAMGMHTFSAIPDIEPDRDAGIRTTATALGERRTYAYCAACWLAAAGVFALVDWRLGALLLAYPVLVFGIVRSSIDVDRAYWWYPYVNTLVGMAFTLGGLWRLTNA
ncbi:prenyltransferase [Halobacterium litoreum]|uniref:Prenyltransferase n=1 Tax=Halobacterium litoreum TaxID=2039234 RepID=A0ABD5NDG3_9EURY|nr:prenyltransferase [Halobacterium litoreum]UHH13998.1 prenyltransferase [Halobacterium litoreum]